MTAALVVESWNLGRELAAGLATQFDALAPQLGAVDEIVVTYVDLAPAIRAELDARLGRPATWIALPSAAGYYDHKNAGFAATTADRIAFLDGDCAPSPGWLAALLAPFPEDARDAPLVVAGATSYPGSFARVANRLDFPYFARHGTRVFGAESAGTAKVRLSSPGASATAGREADGRPRSGLGDTSVRLSSPGASATAGREADGRPRSGLGDTSVRLSSPGASATAGREADGRPRSGLGDTSVRNFFANNVAFARAAFACVGGYPTIASMFHGQCQLLALRLAKRGIEIRYAPDARATHAWPESARAWLATRLLRGADTRALLPYLANAFVPPVAPLVARLGALPALALLGARAIAGARDALRGTARAKNLGLVAGVTAIDTVGALAGPLVYRYCAPQRNAARSGA